MTNLLQDHLDGRYRLTRLLGRGGMSDVYQGVDERTGAAVAIKVVRSADPEHARRLAQEVRALERFDHPGLVRLLDSGVAGDEAYLVMELIDGPSLAQVLRRGPLSTAATARLGAHLAGALAYVHEHGIVHRDVKPGNVLIGSDGSARLGDFGISRLLDASTFTVAGTTLGTAAYMAPEQLENHVVTPAADIWSLGTVLLECLTGRRLYNGSPSEVIAQRLAAPPQLPPSLPEPWRRVLTPMMDPRPDRRPGGAEVSALLGAPELSENWEAWDSPAVLDLAAGRTDDTLRAPSAAATRVDPRPPAGPVRVRSRRRRVRALVALAAVGVCGAFLGVVLAGAVGSNSAQHSTTTAKPPATARSTSATSAPPTPSSRALAALQRDLAAGVAVGTIGQSTSSAVSAAAQQADAAATAGDPAQARTDLQAASHSVTQGSANRSITQAEANTVLGDLSSLAATLGVSTSAPPPPSTAPPPHPHGHGKRHPGGGNQS